MGRVRSVGLVCKVAERQMIRPSFVPPPPIRRLRDLTRYPAVLVWDLTAEKNRVEKLLEDAQIKLSVPVLARGVLVVLVSRTSAVGDRHDDATSLAG